MLDQEEHNEILARWIVDELSEEELKEFQSRPEYPTYLKIKAGADALDLREYNIEFALSAVKSSDKKIKSTANPVRKLWPYAAIAASIAIILGIFLFPSSTSYTSGYGEQMALQLPDGSEVILNAKSTLSFDEQNWDEYRNVDLDGEAYFKVKKGSTFTVRTKNGDVSVLGTEFTVHSNNSLFEAICYEGKVSVSNPKTKKILTEGMAFRSITSMQPENWTFSVTEPSWIHDTSSFRSIPVKFVFDALQKQYNLHISADTIDLQTLYTGTFPNNNKKIALTSVFSTLGYSYRLSEDGKTVVVEP